MGCSPWDVVQKRGEGCAGARPGAGRRLPLCTAGVSVPGRQRRRLGCGVPRRKARREMPGEQRARDGSSGYPQNFGSQVVFNSNTLKAVLREQRKLTAPFPICQVWGLGGGGWCLLIFFFLGGGSSSINDSGSFCKRGVQQVGKARAPPAADSFFLASPVAPSFPGAGSLALPRRVAAGPGRAPLRSGKDSGVSVQRPAEPANIPLYSLALRPLQHLLRPVAHLGGVISILHVIRLAAQGELQPLTAAVQGCLPSLPRGQTIQAAAKGCRPAAGCAGGGSSSSGCSEGKKKKQNKKGLREGGGRGHVAAGAAGRIPAPFAQTARRNTRMNNAPSGGKFHPPVARRSPAPPGRACPLRGLQAGMRPGATVRGRP